MAIVISGVNNNDKITATDGLIDVLSGVSFNSEVTVPSFKVGSNIQLGNAGIATATTFVGNLTGNVNATSNLLLQIGGSEKFRVGSSGQLGIGGANYGTSGQVLTSGGSGSAATWSTVSGTTINNNADNRVITGSGTANTLNAESKVVIDSSGNVGIGTTSPSTKFEVQTAGGERIQFLSNGSNQQPRIDLIRDSGTDYSIINAVGAYQIKKGSNLIYQYSNNSHRFSIDGSEKLRIASNGAIGLSGTNYGSSGQVLTSGGSSGAVSWSTVSGTTINSNADNRIITGSGTANTLNGEATLTFTNSGSAGSLNLKRTTSSNQETIFYYGSGGLEIETRESTPIILKTNQQPRLRIASDGDTTISASATSMFTGAALDIVSDKNVETGIDDKANYHLALANPNNDTGEAIGIAFGITDTSTKVGAAIVHERDAPGSQGNMKFFTRPSNAGPPAERMRITSSGEVCIASSQVNNSAKLNIAANGNHITCKSHNTGGYYSIYFRSANTNVGNIYFNSGGTQYNTGSDYRLKQNIVSLTGAIDRIKTLSPKRFNFISESGVTRDGFLAHEVTTVPEAITGTKDAVSTADDVAVGISTYVGEPIYQTIDQSKPVPLLTAAIQEAIAKIETLETKVAVLEGS